MNTAWISTVVRWAAFVLVVWMGYQALPGMVDQVIEWRREDACFDRNMDWVEQGFGSGDYKCVEKEVDTAPEAVVD